jgi:hypothetical protein
MSDTSGTIELAHAQGTLRYSLLGRSLSGGDVVQLCCSGGWITGRFEWEGSTEAPPSFYFSIELAGGRTAQRVLPIPEGALLRWP